MGEWGFKQAKDLEGTSISHWLISIGKPILRESQPIINIPKVEYVRTGRKGNEPNIDGYNVDSISLATFCGLMGSEGWLSDGTGRSANFGCSLGSKALKSFENIINILPFGEWSYYDRLNASKNGIRSYHLANKSLWAWLQSNIGVGAKNKHIPDFVLKGGAPIMQAFLNAYIEGDGHICNKNGTILIRSHSPQMIDELLYLAVLLGYHASISGKTAVILSSGQYAYFTNKGSIHREHYQGKVWCVEIPNGIFFTECNGKVHATGNSNAEAGDYTFARWVIKPRLNWKRAKLQEQLVPKFKDSRNLKLGFEEIVPETAEQRRLDAESGVRTGYLTVNEARIATGKDPLPDNVGDVLLLPLNLIPTPVNLKSQIGTSNEIPKKGKIIPKSLTPDQKKAHWEAYAQKTERQETMFKRVFESVFDEQKKLIVEQYEKLGTLPNDLIDENTAKKFEPAIELVYESAFEDALPSKSVKQMDEFARTWIKLRSLTLARSINMTTLEALRHELALGFEAGESIQQLTKRIEGYFDTNARVRAEMVSRTEVISASNEGALHRFELEGITKSEWLTSRDGRVCEECDPMDGQIFITKEASGMIPRHPQCRCVWLPYLE